MKSQPPSKRSNMLDFSKLLDDNHTNDTCCHKNEEVQQSLPYTVRATKKGGVPCVVESRKHHKVVVLSNVEGDTAALLSVLQKKLGAGGVCKGKSIEVHGEHHLEKIKNFCLNSGCVVGASKQNKAAAAVVTQKKNKTSVDKGKNEASTKTKPSIDVTKPLTSKEVKAMKPTELKDHLSARQLSTQGNKKELISRLLECSQNS
mmetsp:Transcript_14509/g.21388  ORF Transcript_14509/g.21388 Transcript_14509/m.21388 type:complete len:203 (-) Transcript_14509:1445-2053(-)